MGLHTKISEIEKELDSLTKTIEWAQGAREEKNSTLDVDRLLIDISNRITYIKGRL